MDWEEGDREGNIEDRRGIHPAVLGGGGIGALVLAGIGYFVFGINPSTTLQAVEAVQGQGGQAQQSGAMGSPDDKAAQFVDVIGTSTDEVWKSLLPNYAKPRAIVLYDQRTGTGCGMGQTAMGPFYCPQDQRVYLDLSFWNELETRFGAKGDFARAYVIAHEVGHHVQYLTGSIRNGQGANAVGANGGSVRTELQADCYAGVWAAHAGEVSGGKINITKQDIQDGLTAAAAVGDDAIQEATQGRVAPDSFTHGSSAQRQRWFSAGYDSGDPKACDTFDARNL